MNSGRRTIGLVGRAGSGVENTWKEQGHKQEWRKGGKKQEVDAWSRRRNVGSSRS